jgi:hypothetical protein
MKKGRYFRSREPALIAFHGVMLIIDSAEKVVFLDGFCYGAPRWLGMVGGEHESSDI